MGAASLGRGDRSIAAKACTVKERHHCSSDSKVIALVHVDEVVH